MSEFNGHRNVSNGTADCIALVSVGGNLPGGKNQAPIDICRQAVSCIDLLPGLFLVGLSRWFLTSPVPASAQPDYVNAVAAVRVDRTFAQDPSLLLDHLLDIERRFGRKRLAPNAARILDLDIIAIGDLIRLAPDPILPHPRAHERAFVLVPLLDVAPDWVHPVLLRSARALLADLPPQAIRPL